MNQAWLVYWKAATRQRAKVDKIVSVLPANTDVDEVCRFIERLYVLDTATVDEMVRYADDPTAMPYKAERHKIKDSTDVQITCGHNPYLVGSLVRNLRVEPEDEHGPESIYYLEIYQNGKVEEKNYTRSKTGRVSFEFVEDEP